MESLLNLIKTRASTPKLGLPVPMREQIDEALACAQRAPDHGRLRPWRFHVLAGEDLVRLGELFVQAARQQNPSLEDSQADRLRGMPLRAPMIVVVSCKAVTGHKVPVWEQQVAVGCAAQNLQLALHAMGFACMWRTGDMASDPFVKARFGLDEPDQIVGFLYIGTALEAPKSVTTDGPTVVFYGMP